MRTLKPLSLTAPGAAFITIITQSRCEYGTFYLSNSLLGTSGTPGYDKITDFAIGTDRLDGPTSGTAANLAELGRVNTLDQAGISAVLTTTTFLANRAATFSWQDGGTLRTFVALNNGTAGYQSASDAIIDITGYTGALANLAIV